jgi:hypothetical protein
MIRVSNDHGEIPGPGRSFEQVRARSFLFLLIRGIEQGLMFLCGGNSPQ